MLEKVLAWRASPPAYFAGGDLHELDDVTTCKKYTVENGIYSHRFYIMRPLDTEETPLPVVFSFHGGGMVREHSDRDVLFCRRIALNTGCAVVSVDYSLSPEVVFPYALDESEALIRYFADHGQEYMLDMSCSAICGQSSGGNLAFGAAKRLKDAGRAAADLLVLCYSVYDQASDPVQKKSPCPERAEVYYTYFDAYIGDSDPMDPEISPVFADPESFRGLPETMIIDGGKDELKYENLEMVKKLAEADVPVKYLYYVDSPHGFMVNQNGKWEDAQAEAFRRIKEVLRSEQGR